MTAPLRPEDIRALLDDAAAGPTSTLFDAVFAKAERARRRTRAGWVAATVVVVAAAIAVPIALTSGGGPSATVAAPGPGQTSSPIRAANPLQLVGRWKVTAAGEPARSSLILGNQLSLFRSCGLLDGDWNADPSGLFVGSIDGWDGTCEHRAADHTVTWLARVVAFRVVGPDRELLDASGHVVATLAPGAHPTAPPTDASSFAAPPVLTAALRASLAEPAPLPRGVRPATLSSLQGRWRALGPDAGNPNGYAEFGSATWDGSDGCNGEGGRLLVGAGGDLMATSGSSTTVGCDSSPETGWVDQARRAGFVGPDLELFSVTGKRLGRLRAEPTGEVTGVFERVGGPAGAPAVHLSGDVDVHQGSAKGPVVTSYFPDSSGRFTFTLQPGRYWLVGETSHVRINGQDDLCPAFHATVIRVGVTVRTNVYCEVR